MAKAISSAETVKAKRTERHGAGEAARWREIAQVERMLRPRWPLTDVQRAAFRSRFSDAQCDELGVRAKSGQVFREGLEWAARIQKTLEGPHEGLRYSEDRFTWLLECLLALAKERALYKSAQGSPGAARCLGEHARAASLETREYLLGMLAELAGGVEAEVDALARAQGTVSDDGELAASLRALSLLAQDWLRRAGDVDRALVASAGLTDAHAQTAWRSADELDRAASDVARAASDGAEGASDGAEAPSEGAEAASDGDAQGEGEAGGTAKRDPAALVRAQGRLLREMAVAMRSFAEARRRNRSIRKLVPGPGTRSVLKPRKAQAAEQEAPAPAPEAQASEPEETPAASSAHDHGSPYHAGMNGHLAM